MITDLNTSVSTISSEALDQLFAETPDSQVNANDLNIPTDNKPSNVTFDTQNTLNQNPAVDVPQVDLDDLDKQSEEKEEETKSDDKPAETPAKKDEEVKKPEEEKKAEDKKEDTQLEIEAKKELLKNSVNYLVEKKIFKDFEGREELEMDEETFSKLLEQQVEAKVSDLYDSKKKSAGEYGEAILEFLENGGEADKIIDLFKERKEIEQFDIENEDSQAELISKWYKEVHGWKPEKIKKYIDTLNSEEGAVETEADDIKAKYKERYNQQLEQLKTEQREYQNIQQQRQKAFESNITKAIEGNSEFDDKRKRFIKDSIFRFRTLEDGNKVNDFYLKFAEWQNNPDSYIELAEFIMDKEGYLKRKSVEVENNVVKKTFNFVKGNTALSKTKGSKHTETDTTPGSTGTDFSVMFKS